MRIAILSDIHGNLAALDAVLADVRPQAADLVVNLGDILSGPLYPRETADRLMPLGFPTIRGNHERQVLADDLQRMGASDRWARDALRRDQLDWIAGLPTELMLEGEILLVHGTSDDDLGYFLETVTESGCRAATLDEVEQRAGSTEARLVLCGHTHVQRAVRLDDGRLIVNPGSVGLQAYEDSHPFPHRIEMGSPHARYAVATRTTTGWKCEFRAVEYDWHAAAATADANGRPDWAVALRSGQC